MSSLIPTFLDFSEIEQAEAEFFNECDNIARAPAVYFLKGDDYSFNATAIPLPIDVCVGIKENCEKLEIDYMSCDCEVNVGFNKIEKANIRKLKYDKIEGIIDRLLDNRFEFFKEKTVRRLKKSKIKIWSNIPYEYDSPLNLESSIITACALLFCCLDKDISYIEFNKSKAAYKEEIRRIGDFKNVLHLFTSKTNKKLASFEGIFKAILKCGWSFLWGNGAAIFTSLFGSTQQISYGENMDGLSFQLSIPKSMKNAKNIYDVFSYLLKKGGDRPLKNFMDYVEECIENQQIKISLIKNIINNAHISLIYWKDQDKSLLNSILKSHSSAKVIYSHNYIALIGSSVLLRKAEKVISESYEGWVHYSSRKLGWEINGATFLLQGRHKLLELLDRKRKEGRFILEIIETNEGLWYKNLGVKIDSDDKPKVTFYSVDKKEKEVLVKFGVKSFALLVRLAVAMRTYEIAGYVYIHPMSEKIKKCFKECGYRRNEKCLYFDYRGTERFRTLLARKDIFGLSEEEKRNLIWTDKSEEKIKGRVRLAIPAKNIDINIAHIKKFKDRLDPQQGTSKEQKKGIELAKILLGDACKAYDEYLCKSSNSPTQKL